MYVLTTHTSSRMDAVRCLVYGLNSRLRNAMRLSAFSKAV